MKTTVFAALAAICMLVGGGCQLDDGADQDFGAEALAWKNARVVEEINGGVPILISVATGDGVVLMSNEGWSHGKHSSAHASHWAFYMTLPSQLREGEVYHVSRRDGTLYLSAFFGDDMWYLDPTQPSEGTVKVREVRSDAIVAELDINAIALWAGSGPHELQKWRKPVARAGSQTFEFRRIP
jgi:hypothetical protein